jgi:hypothetical protein
MSRVRSPSPAPTLSTTCEDCGALEAAVFARLCPKLCPLSRSSLSAASRRSPGDTMLYRSETERVLWPVIVMATRSGMPARTRFRTAVRRKSWGMRPGHPAARHAAIRPQAFAPRPVSSSLATAADCARPQVNTSTRFLKREEKSHSQQLAALLTSERPEQLDENRRRWFSTAVPTEWAVLAHLLLPPVPDRLRTALLLRGICTTPFDSSHVRNARRICSENGTPSRSRNDVMASKMSLSGRKVMTRSLGGICINCNTNTTMRSTRKLR